MGKTQESGYLCLRKKEEGTELEAGLTRDFLGVEFCTVGIGGISSSEFEVSPGISWDFELWDWWAPKFSNWWVFKPSSELPTFYPTPRTPESSQMQDLDDLRWKQTQCLLWL